MGIGMEAMLFLFGAFLLLTAILGGGFEIKELRVPTVSAVVRVLSGASGLAFVVVGIALSPIFDVPPGPSPRPSETVAADDPTPPAPSETVAADDPTPPVNLDQDCSANFASCADMPAQAVAYTYVNVTDDTGRLQVAIPAEWGEINGAPYEDGDGNTVLDVRASSDLDGFHTTWSTPGVIVSASTDVTDEGIEAFRYRRSGLGQECQVIEDQPYDDGVYVGISDLYWGCGGSDAMYIVITALPEDGSFVIGAEMLIVDERDLRALDQMIASFSVTAGDELSTPNQAA
jgi:hypothetical protein